MNPDDASVLLCAPPIHGHVSPLLVLARELVASGSDVEVITGARFAGAVRATGAGFRPLPADADFDDRDLTASFPERARLHGVAQLRHDLSRVFLRPTGGQLEVLREAVADRRPDLVLADTAFVAASLLAREPVGTRPRVVALSSVPYQPTSRDTAPPGLGLPPLVGPLGRLRNRLLNALVEGVLLRRCHREADALFRDLVGSGLDGGLFSLPLRADAYLQSTVAGFEYPMTDLPEHVRFIGPVVGRGATGTDAELPAWWGDLDGRQVVHVTQGTLANTDLTELVVPALRALADTDVLVVVATGGRGTADLETAYGAPLPENARVAAFLPYDRLLPLTAAMITNGGYGGVHCALRHGVPLVAAGRTEDKADVSARVGWSGVGVDLRTQRPSPAAVRAAVDRVLGERTFRRRARVLQAEIAATDPVGTVRRLARDAARVGWTTAA